ncbi:hypothetical protein BOX15_Mlig002657g3 [Macrostomum lignano]|uniref:Uncharacterized protein n=1 Tax=Macrostomum lignano TaxID=282301 RepID=A0A267GG12_9PLAT|nr:hypothetical protein BOX15_Mlig002657g2 [Macrostomum lignano]PAA59249.1 hypothetical protein BOX15_Mlig002657g1 [Macrostomum lignano]PAA84152.1 hypothetical protein BOX15_Mlig002657g3 [Macrostomum lignano]
MADPNQPADMAATGGGDGRPRRLKKLPSLGGQAAPGDAGTALDAAQPGADGAPRPRRKKKRQPASAADAEASPDHGTAPISAQQQLLPAPAAGDDGAATGATSGGAAAPRPRRKKRRQPASAAAAAAATAGTDAPEAEEARRSPEGREAEPAAAAAAPRTRYIDVEGMPLAKALETVRADVVTREGAGGRVNFGADLADGGPAGDVKADDEDEAAIGGGGGGRAGESNMSDTIFWQTQDAKTFKAEKLDKYQQRLEQERKEREQYLEGVVEEDTSNRTLKCAIGFTKVYNYLGTVLLGLMPGFALLHTVYVWTLSSNYLSFLADYSRLGSPMPILYYVVLTLILLSVLDRYDTGKLDRGSCLECASFRHGGMVVLLYIPAYVVSNAMYPTDQWMRGYSLNATAYAGIANGDSLVQSWRIMDTVRAACLALGWLVVAFNPQFNRLADNLETELDDLIGEEQQLEMGAGGATQAGRTQAGRTLPAPTVRGQTMTIA